MVRLSDRQERSLTIIAERPVLAGVKIKHLKCLETESIGIMREVVAEFRNPVMLYSIGKDSTVMVHLARKAFFRARPLFPLLHIDTGWWRFREMIAFRDATARRLGLDLLVHANEEGRALGISSITSGSALYTEVRKTEALKQALDRYAFDEAFGRGAARRGEEPRQGAFLSSQCRAWLEPEEPASGTMAAL
jgi:sulfate adenylyltransferase subunit 2